MKLLHAESTWIEESVDTSRIAGSAVIHAGCRLKGAATSIGPGCVIGEEGPATIDNCQLGNSVHLKGGCFHESVFLNESSVGPSAQVRSGCILEEKTLCGHGVGMKHTVLFPFVAMGSHVNFCDCLISGGTGSANCSEIGSSFVHFNFTPYQDKATASLFGSVPEGVMLNQQPIFLGGQGGAVGPVRLAHGCTLAAGSILRKDCTGSGTLIIETPSESDRLPMPESEHRNYRRIVSTGLEYLGNIVALTEWYRHVRKPASSGNSAGSACSEGAINCLNMICTERVSRLADVMAAAGTLKPDLEEFRKQLPALHKSLETIVKQSNRKRDSFLASAGDLASVTDYVEFVREMPDKAKLKGSEWLQSLVDSVTRLLRCDAGNTTHITHQPSIKQVAPVHPHSSSMKTSPV